MAPLNGSIKKVCTEFWLLSVNTRMNRGPLQTSSTSVGNLGEYAVTQGSVCLNFTVELCLAGCQAIRD